jgi:hypothetical protein
VLLAAVLFTQIGLQNYDGVIDLSGNFVWPVAARNLWLLVYLILICGPILAAGRSVAAETGSVAIAEVHDPHRRPGVPPEPA